MKTARMPRALSIRPSRHGEGGADPGWTNKGDRSHTEVPPAYLAEHEARIAAHAARVAADLARIEAGQKPAQQSAAHQRAEPLVPRWALERITPRFRAAFARFVETGEAGPGLLEYLAKSKVAHRTWQKLLARELRASA